MTQTSRIKATKARTGSPQPAGVRSTSLAQSPSYRKHVLDLDDFSREEIEAILQNTAVMKEVMHRDIKKVPTLRGKTVVSLFYEASTRTRVSFEQAGKILSADGINVSVAASSVKKGETLYNTALTIQAMNADIVSIIGSNMGGALPSSVGPMPMA